MLTLASRFGGLARDAVMARVFGISAVMDAFALGFMVPNLFRRLFGEGALSAAFLPAYVRVLASDPAAARRLSWLVIGGATAVLSAIVLVIEIALAIGAVAGLESLGVTMLAMMLPYAPLVCLVALVGAMLQVHGRFGPTAAAPIILNASLVGASLLPFAIAVPAIDAGGARHAMIVAAAVLVAGVVQVAWSLRALRRCDGWRDGWRSRGARSPDADAATRGEVRRVLGQVAPMLLGLGVLQLNTLLDGVIASWPTLVGPTIGGIDYPLPEGSMSALGWAQRLYEFPLGVFGIAVATAIFPQLARESDDPAAFRETLARGVRLCLFIGLPASAGLILVREPLAATILQGRAFDAEDTRRTAFILLGYAPAIWAYCINQTLVRAFYARGEAQVPVRIALAVVVLNLALNLSLIWTPLGVAGLAWSTAICALAQTVLLRRALVRRLGSVDERRVSTQGIRSSAIRSIGLTAAMAAIVWAADVALRAGLGATALPPDGWLVALARLLLATALGAIVVAVGARALRMPELRWALGRTTSERAA